LEKNGRFNEGPTFKRSEVEGRAKGIGEERWKVVFRHRYSSILRGGRVNVIRALKWKKVRGFFDRGGIVRGKRPEMSGFPLFSTSV